MKTATNNLERDHEHIIKLTEIMGRMTTSPNVQIDHIEMAVFLIKKFADGLHHAKENNILFRMADSVFSAAEQQQLLTQFGEIENHNEHGKPAGFYAAIEALDHEYTGGNKSN